jgi:hypothetical protein
VTDNFKKTPNPGRSFDDLSKFVTDNLVVTCTMDNRTNCTDKEKSYMEKIEKKSEEDNEKE